MDFCSARQKRAKFEHMSTFGATHLTSSDPLISDQIASVEMSSNKSSHVPSLPSNTEIQVFYQRLATCGHKPALLSIVAPYSDEYTSDDMTRSTINILPLSQLYSGGYSRMSLAELQSVAETVDVSVSKNDAEAIEVATSGQHENKLWYQYRAGRITASKMKEACCTSLSKPSASLLKTICYPQQSKFKSAATQWGIKQESAAVKKYKQSMLSHSEFTVKQCGFVMNTEFPFVGSSPDSLVSCCCCGLGVLEVKCPYKERCSSIQQYLLSDSSCFLLEDNEILLDRRHQYYYQVQSQLHICNVQYCDFVVCTFPDGEASIYVTRLYRDDGFWDTCLKRASEFFRMCILPELLGHAYTRDAPEE